ncbi:MAG: hypothetical protein HN722_04260 [Nitrospina sp.]|nr:hypothetical protein [Nitrospina sp.]
MTDNKTGKSKAGFTRAGHEFIEVVITAALCSQRRHHSPRRGCRFFTPCPRGGLEPAGGIEPPTY